MAVKEANRQISFLAGSDFTGDLHKLCEISAANTVDVVNATTDHPVGVIAEEVLAGVEVPVTMLEGRVKVLAGAAITVGQLLVPDAAGAVTGVADLASIPVDSMAVGVAITAAAGAGEIIEMLAGTYASPHTA